MLELAGAHPALLASIERRIGQRLAIVGEGDVFRIELATRSRRIVRLAVDLRLKAFLGRAVDGQAPHAEWLEGLGMVIDNRPPAEWTDGEITRFEVGLEELRALFLRAEDLAVEGPSAAAETSGGEFGHAKLSATSRAAINRAIELQPVEQSVIESAEREILQMLEGRFGAKREVWLAALGRTLNTLLEPASASVRPTDGLIGERDEHAGE